MRRQIKTEGFKDFFPTPSWAIRSLLASTEIKPPVWDPCCGKGHIINILKEKEIQCFGSDIENYGYSISDFLAESPALQVNVPTILTNPPYSMAQDFIMKSFKCAETVIMLLPLAFLCGKKRAETLFLPKGTHYLKYVFILPERIDFELPTGKKSSNPAGSAWFCWHKTSKIKSFLYPEIIWLNPNSKKLYTF